MTMLSFEDLESLIASKKREIKKEKAILGLTPPISEQTLINKENDSQSPKKQVKFNENKVLGDHNAKSEGQRNTGSNECEEHIPADLERYIRRYIGLPVMLKAGEFSPNNPLVRGERICGDALVGLGEYERRRNTLRKIRQAQYREYLDRQAKKKQEAKEEAEKERREHEEKEREREERERQLLLERERYSPERRRASVSCVPVHTNNSHTINKKVDSAVQMDGVASALSVAVQTDDAELYRLSPCPALLTQAERELSPRTVEPRWDKWEERRRSYGDLDERTSTIKKTNRDKLHSDLRHSYMPSIFDADAIELRNLQVEKDAAERRQSYQQELKNQIMEQQRIREERKTREKLLEQAEMRRLEEQLRMLRVAQEREIDKQHDITSAMKENSKEYESMRSILQRDITTEHNRLRAASHPARISRTVDNSEKLPSKYYQGEVFHAQGENNYHQSERKLHGLSEKKYTQSENSFRPVEKKPYSFNIPDNSIFSSNYDVDSYLRKNLNFKNKHGVDIFSNTNTTNDLEHTRNDQELRSINEKITRKFGIEKERNYNEINPDKQINETNNEIVRNYLVDHTKTMNDFDHTRNDEELRRVNEKMSDRKCGVEKERNYNEIDFPDKHTIEKKNIIDRKYVVEKANANSDLDFPDTRIEKNSTSEINENRKYVIEKALIHEPKERIFAKKDTDSLSIPVLRHSPMRADTIENTSPLSDAMKIVDDKWKVPAIQKNILKSLPNDHGKNISILTQLGSIRRQLQLEQLKLDKMLNK